MIYSAALLVPAMAVADPDPATFQADKDRQIANVLERVRIAQKNLSCVQAAQDHAVLNACDESFNQDHKALEPKVEAPIADKKAPIADKNIQKNSKNKQK